MTAKGHMALASAVTLSYLYVDNDLISTLPYFEYFLIAILIGSLFPDIDEPESYIGNKLKVVSILTSVIFKHRTFTHYLIFPLALIFIALYVDNTFNKVTILGFAIGILLHDAGDMLTNGAIKGFLWPIFPNTRIALLPNFLRFNTFSIQEYILVYLVLTPLNIFLVLHLLSALGWWNI
jgi:inner membrane protein